MSIRSQFTPFADTIAYTASLAGANESPAVASPGTGFAEITIDTVAQTMLVDVTFSDLLATDTAAHIHCCVAPGGNAGGATVVPSFTGFPIGVTSGTYDQLFDLTDASTYNPAFITANGGTVAGTEAALLAGVASDEAYLNIHVQLTPRRRSAAFWQSLHPSRGRRACFCWEPSHSGWVSFGAARSVPSGEISRLKLLTADQASG